MLLGSVDYKVYSQNKNTEFRMCYCIGKMAEQHKQNCHSLWWRVNTGWTKRAQQTRIVWKCQLQNPAGAERGSFLRERERDNYFFFFFFFHKPFDTIWLFKLFPYNVARWGVMMRQEQQFDINAQSPKSPKTTKTIP